MRLLPTGVLTLAIASSVTRAALADDCRPIRTHIETGVAACDADFASPIGLCTTGTIDSGPLAGTTRFRALTFVPAGNSPFVFHYTGQLEITTRSGTVRINDFGVINMQADVFAELDKVTGGTGRFAGATGTLVSQGTAVNGAFSGSLVGAICTDHHGHKADAHERADDAKRDDADQE